MKLKTLLLGSAAAMIAVSGARAADAVIAEPEPVDYVKVCDMYGAGFFYIPGTETCLKINGYVDVQYEYTSRNNIGPNLGGNLQIGGFPGAPAISPFGRSSIGEPVFLARVNFDAREETDWGTLQSYIRLEGSGGNGAAGAGITALDVYLSLGGFSAGHRTVATETGGLPGLMLDGYYGGGRHWYMDYTYAANGFSATAGFSLDDGSNLAYSAAFVNMTSAGGGLALGPAFGFLANLTGNRGAGAKSMDPYVVASYTGSMWTIRGKYHYDTSATNSWYGIDGSVTPIDGLTIRGWYEKATGITEYASAISSCGNLGINIINTTNINNGLAAGCGPAALGVGNLYTDNTWGVGASWAVLDNVSLALGYSQAQILNGYQRGINAAILAGAIPAGTIANLEEDVQSYVVGLDWNPVDNLVVRMNYRRQEWGPSKTDEFRVRLRRSF